MKRIAALIGAGLSLFALGFNFARGDSPGAADDKGAPTYTYSTTYVITEWEVNPARTRRR